MFLFYFKWVFFTSKRSSSSESYPVKAKESSVLTLKSHHRQVAGGRRVDFFFSIFVRPHPFIFDPIPNWSDPSFSKISTVPLLWKRRVFLSLYFMIPAVYSCRLHQVFEWLRDLSGFNRNDMILRNRICGGVWIIRIQLFQQSFLTNFCMWGRWYHNQFPGHKPSVAPRPLNFSFRQGSSKLLEIGAITCFATYRTWIRNHQT